MSRRPRRRRTRSSACKSARAGKGIALSGSARRGVVLITVLWTVALLATLAMATSLTFRGFAGIMAIDRDRLKADGLLTAGPEDAARLVSRAGDRPLPEAAAGGRFAVL